ncbi:MAG: hypothetical protein R3Y29_06775 [bacterium]
MKLIKTISELKSVFPKILTNEFINSMPRRELTPREKNFSYSKYYYKDMAEIPQEDLDIVNQGAIDKELALNFSLEELQKIFDDGYLKAENGYCSMKDGTGFASSKVFMKDASLDMLDWWFNWHCLEDLRYAIWCPVAHNGIKAEAPNEHLDSSGIDLKIRNYNKTHYPDEGFNLANSEVVKIDFKDPKDLGLDIRNTRAYIANVSKQVGNFNMPITTFIHVAREVEDGVEFRSRYFTRTYINDDFELMKCKGRMPETILVNMARNNCLHSLIEYNNLASILPTLYKEQYGKIM